MKYLLLFFLGCSIFVASAHSELLMHESFELQRGNHENDIGYYPDLRPRNNSCSSIDFGVCGNTCGNSNQDLCCRSGYTGAETKGSVIEDWATARFTGGQTWKLDGTTYKVPQPVDGEWVYRAYVPDCGMGSPYRCNDFSPPVRLRALIASTSNSNINSATKSRWYGLSTYIDPAWNFDNWPLYSRQTMMSQHLPNNHDIGGGGPIRVILHKGWKGRIEWIFLAAVEATSTTIAKAAGCDSVSFLKKGYGCTDRAMTILDEDGSSSGNDYLLFDHDRDLGNWVHWVIHIKNDSSGKGQGILQIWKKSDGVAKYHKIIDFSGAVGVMSSTPPYFKFGISDKATYGACPEILYYDNFKVGDESSNISEVDPSGGSKALASPDEFKVVE